VATQIVSQYVRPAVPSVFEPAVKPHASVYEIVTSRILAELEKGQVPWRKPWRTLPPANLISKKPYRGINVFLLALAGYGSQYWLTYRQAQALGGNVRRGGTRHQDRLLEIRQVRNGNRGRRGGGAQVCFPPLLHCV
jgi:antirestriction protein ArdC